MGRFYERIMTHLWQRNEYRNKRFRRLPATRRSSVKMQTPTAVCNNEGGGDSYRYWTSELAFRDFRGSRFRFFLPLNNLAN